MRKNSDLESGSCWQAGIFKTVCPESGILPTQTSQCSPKHGSARLATHGRIMLRGKWGFSSVLAHRNFRFGLTFLQSASVSKSAFSLQTVGVKSLTSLTDQTGAGLTLSRICNCGPPRKDITSTMGTVHAMLAQGSNLDKSGGDLGEPWQDGAGRTGRKGIRDGWRTWPGQLGDGASHQVYARDF